MEIDIKDLFRAQSKFNSMYKRVYRYPVPEAEIEIVRNYGNNLMKLFDIPCNSDNEIYNQVLHLSSMLHKRRHNI